MRLLATLHDPWMALCFAHALGDELAGVLTYGEADFAERFAALGLRAVLVPPAPEATTTGLLADERGAAFIAEEPSRLLCFKPSRRLEERAAELGATLALAPASLAQRLENKLVLAELAREAGIPTHGDDVVGLPAQRKTTVRANTTFAALQALVETDGPVVVQAPRGFMGRKTWRVDDEAAWAALRPELERRPTKVTRWVDGRPGTLNVVVDRAGTILCTAPIVQITGEPRLTPYPLGSCGNDFTWRCAPDPRTGPYELARRLGTVLAARGYRGHFGIDFVVDAGRTWIIEINPRLTASMALYAAFRPLLARAHLLALDGEELRSTGELPPLEAGQLIVHNLGESTGAPLTADEVDEPLGTAALPSAEAPRLVWPSITSEVAPGATRGRRIRKGALVTDEGALLF